MAGSSRVADQQAQVHAAPERFGTIKSEIAALTAEKQKLDAAKATGAQAAVTGSR